MFEVIRSPDFMKGFDPVDPLNRLNATAAERSAAQLAKQIDVFVRAALAKVVSPETLAFFVETRMAIPGVDLVMTLIAPHSRTLDVQFKKKSVAKVRFDTEIKQDGNEYLIRHIQYNLWPASPEDALANTILDAVKDLTSHGNTDENQNPL